MFLTILGALKALIKPAKWAIEQIGVWAANRAELQAATHDATIAAINAKTELAVAITKADLEWDLAWAGQSGNTWKDEFVLGLYSVPIIMFFPALLPGSLGDFWMAHYVDLLKTMEQVAPSVTTWYWGGWAAMIAAIYGNKGAMNFMLGDKVSKIAQAFAPLPDDIPPDAVKAAEDRIKALVAKRNAAKAKTAQP